MHNDINDNDLMAVNKNKLAVGDLTRKTKDNKKLTQNYNFLKNQEMKKLN